MMPETPQDPNQDPRPVEPILHSHRTGGLDDLATGDDDDFSDDAPARPSALPKYVGISLTVLVILLIVIFFSARLWARHAMDQSLPQIDGALSIPGLAAPVTVQRDAHGFPHIHAATLDDLVIAQGYVTAQDRLWQMETLRRHAAGTLAEILGDKLIAHDRTQRTLQISETADRATAALPTDQLHWLELYARGVNASIADQHDRLPIEFRLLRFTPAPWTPRDSILISLVMYQDLTTRFPAKLSREVIASRLPPALLDDLYPVGSWRDHPPTQPVTNLTDPATEFEPIPLDDSQTRLRPAINPGAPYLDSEMWASRKARPSSVSPAQTATSLEDLRALNQSLGALNFQPSCDECMAGSNNWVISGAHTANGKPLLANDMHLAFSVPGLWYETDLQAPGPTGADFHVTGVALPGAPFIIVGHNDHVAWGFTNLGADVQDLYVERTRVVATSAGSQTQFLAADGTWKPIVYRRETIHVHNGKDIAFDVALTQHGGDPTPIITSLFTTGAPGSSPIDKRNIALRWTVYNPANVTDPFFAINSAADGTSLVAAFSTWGGPSQNLVYADDQGHIGYHALGRIPVRGSITAPTPLSFVPVAGVDPTYDWAGYIPYEQLPQIVDPPSGVIATANARITPDNYPYPIALDWEAPYRNERIWKVLLTSKNVTPADSLHLQADLYSEVDRALAHRIAYAIDHSDTVKSAKGSDAKRLHLAADILRNWNGSVDAASPAPAIVDVTRLALWPMILSPKVGNLWELYAWGEKTYAEEQIIMHAPARWLPKPYTSWDDLLAAAVERGLVSAHAPSDLGKWSYGSVHTIDIEHPIFGLSPIIPAIIGLPTGTGARPLSGDGTTVRQSRNGLGPSERFNADLGDLDQSTLNILLGQSENPASPWFLDQWPAWYHATTFPLNWTPTAVQKATTHTLTLNPK